MTPPPSIAALGELVRLDDICAYITDGKHGDCQDEAGSGFYFLSCKDIADGRLNYGDARQITRADFLATHERTRLEPADILITNSGTIGRMAIAPDDALTKRTTFQKSVALLKPMPALVEPSYLFYHLRSEVSRLADRAGGTAQKNLLLRDLRSFQIHLPPLSTQRKIAAMLSAYDDLIENNNRRIKLLEEIAQRIYREWFVDFRYPGYQNVPLADSELGPIPQGWSLRPLFDVADVTFGFPFKSELFNTEHGLPVIRIRDIPIGESATLTTEEPDHNYRVDNGDILIGMDGDFHMGRWSAGDAWLNQRVTRLRVASGATCRYALFLALEKPIADWNQAIVGTTVAHLGKRHLELITVPTPPASLGDALAAILNPIFDLEMTLRKATRQLRLTRDLLLPRLISGKVDVADLVIAMAEDAA